MTDKPSTQTTPTAAMIEAGAIAIFAAQFGPEPAMIHAGAKDWHNFGEAVHDEFRRAANMAYRAMEAARAKPPENTTEGFPMGSAPRDGRKIWVRSTESGRWSAAEWNPEGDSWADENGNPCDAGLGTIQVTGTWSSDGGWFQPNEVDRWKPFGEDVHAE